MVLGFLGSRRQKAEVAIPLVHPPSNCATRSKVWEDYLEVNLEAASLRRSVMEIGPGVVETSYRME